MHGEMGGSGFLVLCFVSVLAMRRCFAVDVNNPAEVQLLTRTVSNKLKNFTALFGDKITDQLGFCIENVRKVLAILIPCSYFCCLDTRIEHSNSCTTKTATSFGPLIPQVSGSTQLPDHRPKLGLQPFVASSFTEGTQSVCPNALRENPMLSEMNSALGKSSWGVVVEDITHWSIVHFPTRMHLPPYPQSVTKEVSALVRGQQVNQQGSSMEDFPLLPALKSQPSSSILLPLVATTTGPVWAWHQRGQGAPSFAQNLAPKVAHMQMVLPLLPDRKVIMHRNTPTVRFKQSEEGIHSATVRFN
ncbi:unnamed protein product [Cuscuta campestris]|uniref:Uncharacterized protein n=1 Tax=Cuscuta campestris TaxID=132261 RepID=A0A484KRX6_9ASTE|nr:unnamed protein product [Cuscuta campestris]